MGSGNSTKRPQSSNPSNPNIYKFEGKNINDLLVEQ